MASPPTSDFEKDEDNDNDTLFWRQMNSIDCAFDAPGMSSQIHLPEGVLFDVLVSTAAGKPLFHYGSRPYEQVVSLSAACVAYSHATHTGEVRSIYSPRDGRILFGNFGHIFAVVLCTDKNIPAEFLKSLATVSITSIYFLLSKGFSQLLSSRPNLDLGNKNNSDVVNTWTRKFIGRTIAFPIGFTLELTNTLPCAYFPHSLRTLGNLLRAAWKSSKSISHVLALSASPPFPHRIISCISPVYQKLSVSDLTLIAALLPLNLKTDDLDLPSKIFLQTNNYSKASIISTKLVELRLNGNDFEAFRNHVGGEQWRPQWNADGANAVWLVIISDYNGNTNTNGGINRQVLNELERKMDRSSLAKDIMIWLERPFKVADLIPNAIKGVRFIAKIVGNKRILASPGCLGYECGLEIIRLHRENLLQSSLDTENNNNIKPNTNYICRRNASMGLWIFMKNSTFVFLDLSLSLEKCRSICDKYILPWFNANGHLLFSQNNFVDLPPETPLSFLLAPFES